ncbi:hypothetical protein BH09BAC5_BH09BAC5_18050 [soil metagenome]
MKHKLLFILLFISGIANAQLTVSLVSSSASCTLPCNGTVTVSASGGTAPYTYVMAPTVMTNSTGIFTGVCGGSYTVTVVDLIGNTGSYSGSIQLATPPIISGVVTSPVNAPFNYRATATITGGNPPYYVVWKQLPFSNILRQDTVQIMSDTLSGLAPGDYTVEVTDSLNTALGCTGISVPFPFSICDPNIGAGIITVVPNDTVCVGEQIVVTYQPILFGPVMPLAQTFVSDNLNCDPSSSTNGSYMCNIMQTTTFSGFWIYGTCAPIIYPSLTVTVLPCVGIEEQKIINEISVYPNPGDGSFTIKTGVANTILMTVYDATGRSCFTGNVKNGDKIQTQLPAGIYNCRFESGNEVTNVKLVIVQ